MAKMDSCPFSHYIKNGVFPAIPVEPLLHFSLDHLKLFDPSANICAGVRWLFRKKVTASSKLGRKATWIETVADYK